MNGKQVLEEYFNKKKAVKFSQFIFQLLAVFMGVGAGYLNASDMKAYGFVLFYLAIILIYVSFE